MALHHTIERVTCNGKGNDDVGEVGGSAVLCSAMTTKKGPLERFSIEYAHTQNNSRGSGGYYYYTARAFTFFLL